MKLSVALIVVLGLALISAEDCNNPLLKRSEIIARYGGSGNILGSPVTADSSIPICDYLKGKKVCVSSAGYANFANVYKDLKAKFVETGGAKNKERFGNLSSLANVDGTQCVKSYMTFVLFLTTAAFGSLGGSNNNINLADIVPQIKTAVNQLNTNSAEIKEFNDAFAVLSPIIKNVTLDKANCAKHLMQNYIYTTCAASEAAYTAKVSGTTDSPLLKVKSGFCNTVTNTCRNYISSMKVIGEASIFLNLCGNDDVKKVYDLIMNQAWSDSVNNQLKEILNRVMTTGGSIGTGSSVPIGSMVSCSNVEPGQNQCNFVCQYVFNATGFKQTAFDDLNPTATSRLLQSSTFQESSDSGLDSPDEATKNEDTSVSRESSIGEGGGSGSNAFGLIFSIVPMIIAALSLF